MKLSELLKEIVRLELEIHEQSIQVQFFPKQEQPLRLKTVSDAKLVRDALYVEVDKVVPSGVV